MDDPSLLLLLPFLFVHFLVRSFALFINRTRNCIEWHQVFTKSIRDVDYYSIKVHLCVKSST